MNLSRSQSSALVSPVEWERRLHAMHGVTDTDDRITALLNSLPGNTTLLDWDLRITNMSTSARRLSAQWTGHGAFKKLNVRHRTQLVAMLR